VHGIRTNPHKHEHDKKHHHQSVRFLSDHKHGKAKRAVALAESEESIISESSYDRYAPGFFEHAVMNLKYLCLLLPFCQTTYFVHSLVVLFFFIPFIAHACDVPN
jgi:hypothetical protein